MEKVVWISLLYDFYGQLLTEKQQEFIELYYGDDLSLAEIASICNVTRQAVHDTIKRAEKILNNYEEKLGLVAKLMEERNKKSEALKLIEKFHKDNDVNHIYRVEEILRG